MQKGYYDNQLVVNALRNYQSQKQSIFKVNHLAKNKGMEQNSLMHNAAMGSFNPYSQVHDNFASSHFGKSTQHENSNKISFHISEETLSGQTSKQSRSRVISRNSSKNSLQDAPAGKQAKVAENAIKVK